MSTRTIRFKFLNLDGVYSIDTDARTYGELKGEIEADYPDLYNKFNGFSDIQLIDRDTKTIYSLSEAVLPSVDCIMFVSAVKSKGGAIVVPSNYDELHLLDGMTYNELRSLGSILNTTENANISLSGSKEEVYDRIRSYLEDCFETDCENDSDQDNSLRGTLIDIAQQILDVANSITEEENVVRYNDAVILVTEEDLDEESAVLRNQLGS